MMSTPLLRRDSTAYAALAGLNALGGKATRQDLLASVQPQFRANRKFNDLVMNKLLGLGFVQEVDGLVILQPAGKDHLRAQIQLPAAVNPAMPTAPYRGTGAALNLAKLMQSAGRSGAMDYRDIPSRMGEQRIPFRGGID